MGELRHYHVWVSRREQDYPGGPLVSRLRRRPQAFRHRTQANRERRYIALGEGIDTRASRALRCLEDCR